MITAMVGGAVRFGLEGRGLVVALAWGALVGGALTLLVQVPFLLRHVRGMRVSLGRGVTGVSAESGEILWETGEWKIGIATVPTPVPVGDDRVFFSGGITGGRPIGHLLIPSQPACQEV